MRTDEKGCPLSPSKRAIPTASASHVLSLFQLTDSFFPSGGFAYSWGLETFVSDGLIRNGKGLERFLRPFLQGVVARSDALVVKLAHEAVGKSDLAEVFRLDRLLHAMKTARECREGSLQIGKQILRVMIELQSTQNLKCVKEALDSGAAFGHHASIFGVVCREMDISRRDALLAFLYQTASSVIRAGIRLIPLGHMDGQKALSGVRPLLEAIVDEVLPLSEADIASFAPGVKIRAMRHELLYSRLFRS